MQVFTKLQTVFVILWLADQFSRIASQTCSSDNSVYGYMLRGNIFKTLQTALPFECSQACEGDVRCQSFNYVISKNTCELNDRTKKARPADFLPSSERYYYEKSKNRAALGSIPELPAKNYREIKLSEGEQTVSGKYWYYNPWTDTATFAYCDMKTEDVDECEYDLYYCEANSYCSNTVGSYICTSDRGLASSSILNNSPKYYIGTLSSYLDSVLTNLSSSRFVRCYHAKTDGWDSTTFHSKCDGKGPTVSIIQVGNYTFGGYTDVSWQIQLDPGQMFPILYILYFPSLIPLRMATSQQCEPSQQSESGKALKGHIFKSKKVQDPYQCLIFCYSEFTCQSYNYVITGKLCELNNRTKEARPGFFVRDETRFYMRRWKNRVSLGSVPEMPAESCREIKASEQGMAVSGRYWLEPRETKMKSKNFLVYCDMVSVDQVWTLLARFSNSDTKNWMDDSGDWWYDSTQAAGETADPSYNADMISPAFWLIGGSELKITRNDDSGHTPLLQTIGNCLSGKTFRSKITSYGNFRNGSVWSNGKCLGKCKVQYGGQYQTTEGFGQASCSSDLQGAGEVGFWCVKGWSGSVIMIGGGGADCSDADHGIGTTVAKLTSFKIKENNRRESDFSNDAWGSITKSYSLNLWIR